ncbi:hypothetical protein D3C75_1012860 [compost metagenome]
MARRRQGVDVVGVGPPERDQPGLAQRVGLLQLVLELAPLVAGEERVDQVVPLAPESHPLGVQQGMLELVQWRGEPAGDPLSALPGQSVGRYGVIFHKYGG